MDPSFRSQSGIYSRVIAKQGMSCDGLAYHALLEQDGLVRALTRLQDEKTAVEQVRLADHPLVALGRDLLSVDLDRARFYRFPRLGCRDHIRRQHSICTCWTIKRLTLGREETARENSLLKMLAENVGTRQTRQH